MKIQEIVKMANAREWATILCAAALAGAVVWLFYRRWFMLLPAVPLFPVYLRLVRKERAERRRKEEFSL